MNVKNKGLYWKLVLISVISSFVLYVLYWVITIYYFSPVSQKQEIVISDTLVGKQKDDVKQNLDTLVISPILIYTDSILMENELKKLSTDIYNYMTEVGYKDSTFQSRLDYVVWLYKKKGLTKKQNATLMMLKKLLNSLPEKKE